MPPVGVAGAPPEASSRGRPTVGGPVASGPVVVDSPAERRREAARHLAVRTWGPRGAAAPSRTFQPEAAPDWVAAFPEVGWQTRVVA